MRCLASVVALSWFAVVAAAEDWPQWLGPRRDASTTETIAPWKGELKLLWRQPVGEGNSSPVVAGGRVYLHAKAGDKHEEELIAFDAATGKVLWRTAYPRASVKTLYGNGPRATPAVAGGRVYTFGLSGLLTCFQADTGAKLWQVDTVKEFQPKALLFGPSCSPLVEKDAVLLNIGAKGASIVAFEKTGKVLWKVLDDGASYASPVVFGNGDQRQAVFLTQQGLVSLNPSDGMIHWQSPLKDRLLESSTTPVKAGDLLIAGSITTGSVGLQLQSADGKLGVAPQWKNAALTCYFSTPVAMGAHLYMVVGSNPLDNLNPFAKKTAASLRCIETATGKELWKKDNVGTYHASLLRTGDGKLLMLEDAGNLVLIEPSPKAYHEIARAKACGDTWAHPAVAEQRLYVRDQRGLSCFDLSGGDKRP